MAFPKLTSAGLQGAKAVARAQLNRVDLKKPELLCAFCGKSEDEVQAIVGSVAAMICDECVEVCAQEIERIKVARPRVTIDN